MRIFYAADTTPNPALRSNLWRDNLYQPLVDLGHEVLEFRYDLAEVFRHFDRARPDHRRFIEKSRPRVGAELVRQIRRAHAERPIDLFFSYFYDFCALPEAIDEIRALGIVTANWYCNASYQLHLVSEISPHYDWCLVPEKFRLSDYEALGAHPIYCQMAANPSVYKPSSDPVEFDVTFVGQAYGDRPAILHRLRERGIDVRVWGDGWQRLVEGSPQSRHGVAYAARNLRALGSSRGWAAVGRRARGLLTTRVNPPLRTCEHPRLPSSSIGPPLDDQALIRMYSRSKINLGFSAVGGINETKERILQVRLRDFEVPMSGGFYLVEHIEELEAFYDIGKEIVTYHDSEDLADKILFYLSHDAERERIREAGRRRALRDHTWQQRFTRAFEAMRLS